jgi:hypothetical protein
LDGTLTHVQYPRGASPRRTAPTHIPIADVSQYAVKKTNTGKTIGLVLSLGALAALIAAAASCYSSCGASLGGY